MALQPFVHRAGEKRALLDVGAVHPQRSEELAGLSNKRAGRIVFRNGGQFERGLDQHGAERLGPQRVDQHRMHPRHAGRESAIAPRKLGVDPRRFA